MALSNTSLRNGHITQQVIRTIPVSPTRKSYEKVDYNTELFELGNSSPHSVFAFGTASSAFDLLYSNKTNEKYNKAEALTPGPKYTGNNFECIDENRFLSRAPGPPAQERKNLSNQLDSENSYEDYKLFGDCSLQFHTMIDDILNDLPNNSQENISLPNILNQLSLYDNGLVDGNPQSCLYSTNFSGVLSSQNSTDKFDDLSNNMAVYSTNTNTQYNESSIWSSQYDPTGYSRHGPHLEENYPLEPMIAPAHNTAMNNDFESRSVRLDNDEVYHYNNNNNNNNINHNYHIGGSTMLPAPSLYSNISSSFNYSSQCYDDTTLYGSINHPIINHTETSSTNSSGNNSGSGNSNNIYHPTQSSQFTNAPYPLPSKQTQGSNEAQMHYGNYDKASIRSSNNFSENNYNQINNDNPYFINNALNTYNNINVPPHYSNNNNHNNNFNHLFPQDDARNYTGKVPHKYFEPDQSQVPNHSHNSYAYNAPNNKMNSGGNPNMVVGIGRKVHVPQRHPMATLSLEKRAAMSSLDLDKYATKSVPPIQHYGNNVKHDLKISQQSMPTTQHQIPLSLPLPIQSTPLNSNLPSSVNYHSQQQQGQGQHQQYQQKQQLPLQQQPKQHPPPPPSLSQEQLSQGAKQIKKRASSADKLNFKGVIPAANSNTTTTTTITTTTTTAGNMNTNLRTNIVNNPKLKANDTLTSSKSRLSYKDAFYREYKSKERISVEAAKLFAEESLSKKLPEEYQVRILLELAELAKRNNEFEEARNIYSKVCNKKPYDSDGWLEWSRLEEESGNDTHALMILQKGLTHCKLNESLLTKAIKLQERLHNLREAREMLSVVKHVSIDKIWKAVWEGALLEARAGEIVIARRILKYLISCVSWYGPIYLDAFRLEEKCGNFDAAISIVQDGLKKIPKYGPLWMGLLRLVERNDINVEKGRWMRGLPPKLEHVRQQVECAVSGGNISYELIWKVHFEQAQVEERAAEMAAMGVHHRTGQLLSIARNNLLDTARMCYVNSTLACPSNLRWKIWLAGARLELSAGKVAKARELLQLAYTNAPEKSRSNVYLECSRLEEYLGNISTARRILARARSKVPREWKIYLETVLLEARSGNLHGAIQAAERALDVHAGTGRLWAVLILLVHRMEGLRAPQLLVKAYKKLIEINQCEPTEYSTISTETDKETNSTTSSEKGRNKCTNSPLSASSTTTTPLMTYECSSVFKILRRASSEVPKSGEVWCEGARTHLNPMHAQFFDLIKAQKYLGFAVQFTPQYGDTFIEYVRLELLTQVILPKVLSKLGLPLGPFLKRFLSEDLEADTAVIASEDRWKEIFDIEPTSSTLHLGSVASTSNSTTSNSTTTTTPASSSSSSSSSSLREERIKAMVDFMTMNFHIEVPVQAYYDVILANIQRRCTNSEPNYGTSWFYCRYHPLETPAAILKIALELMIHEMIDVQKIYVRAIFFFVMRCLSEGSNLRRKCILLADNSSNSSSSNNNVGIENSVKERARRPSSAPLFSGRRDAALFPSSSSSPSNSSSSSNNNPPPPVNPSMSISMSIFTLDQKERDKQLLLSDNHNSSNSNSTKLSDSLVKIWAQQAELENETLDDYQVAWKHLEEGSSSTKTTSNKSSQVNENLLKKCTTLSFVDLDGSLFSAQDFVTALISQNRTFFTANLSLEETRKVLFGSDQIIP